MATEKPYQMTVVFEADSEQALREAVAVFAEETHELLPGYESSLSTAGWRFSTRLTRPVAQQPPTGKTGNA